MTRKLLSNLTILMTYMFIIGTSLYFAYASADFSFLNNGNSFTIEADSFTPDFNSKSTEPGSNTFEYTTQVNRSSFDKLDSHQGIYKLAIYKLADNGFKVYFNDSLIGYRGDMDRGRSNLWNGYTTFLIPEYLIDDNNTLTFETYAIYRTGLSAFPLFIVNEDASRLLDDSINVYGSRGITICLGLLILSIFVVILIYMSSPRRKNVFLMAAFSSLFITFYFYDYLATDNLLVDYLIYKKITMTGLYFGIAFYSFALASYYSSRLLKMMGYLVIASFTVIVLISNSMHQFKTLYTYGYILLLLNIILWIILVLRNIYQQRAVVFLIGFSSLFIFSGIVTFIDLTGGHSSFNSPIVYIAIVGIMPLLMAYEAFQEQEMVINEEKKHRMKAHIDSMTDRMTGVWNQRYLLSLKGNDLLGSVICIIDLDDFKQINDHHGHMSGDIAIHELCRFIELFTDLKDEVIRYGGDEFIILMHESSLDEAISKCEKILRKTQTTWIQVQESKIKISLSIGLYNVIEKRPLKELIDRADFQLYRAKANGKNQISY